MSGSEPSVAVIGAGISGSVAAYRARAALGPAATIDVFEAASHPGGLLSARTVGGRTVDAGAESFIVRRPEAVALIAELGLDTHVVRPTGRRPALLATGVLRELPRPTLMGIPATVDAVDDVIAPADRALMADESRRPLSWSPGDDVAIGELVARRFGRSVVDRSVDPMLSGVYSCHSDDIGVRAALPQLAARLDAGAPSLGAAISSLLPPPSSAPVFGAIDEGYRLLIDTLLETAGTRLHRECAVSAVRPSGARWEVHSATDTTVADAVLVCVPASAAALILADGVPEVAAALRRVEIAGSGLVLLALRDDLQLPDHSGVLVATGEATRAKAITLSSQKWSHLSGGPVLVRASFGRLGDPIDTIDDETLITSAVADLDLISGLSGGPSIGAEDVIDAVVQRWPVGLPRYAPGHLDIVAAVAAGRPRGLALCGSAYDGVGVPACVKRADGAVAQIVGDLAATG
ncbi:FAD-dependent oxidoreductase [Williamsia sp. CHRR-6]|uniref:FAD-dependent oxidoreductase n=1 Tax=Williamsia sp. CHRR-6 TaxID=2835871 RepID=UPI001BD9D466|nr:FAD-dependent oxidoreductase [Williamsia sp. CHRR-6]MBT0567956.1 FAD-dependent oxidoreductase [Williamsia sp. CHRR-6]